jgi:hypothetical protein
MVLTVTVHPISPRFAKPPRITVTDYGDSLLNDYVDYGADYGGGLR